MSILKVQWAFQWRLGFGALKDVFFALTAFTYFRSGFCELFMVSSLRREQEARLK